MIWWYHYFWKHPFAGDLLETAVEFPPISETELLGNHRLIWVVNDGNHSNHPQCVAFYFTGGGWWHLCSYTSELIRWMCSGKKFKNVVCSPTLLLCVHTSIYINMYYMHVCMYTYIYIHDYIQIYCFPTSTALSNKRPEAHARRTALPPMTSWAVKWYVGFESLAQMPVILVTPW